MINIQTLSILFLIISCNLTTAQYCEEYDRNLFQLLPDDFPAKINCRDSSDRKQGWWIEYRIHHSTTDKPDEAAKGNYVENYTYGKFLDNIKVGDWISVSNVPQICIKRKDNYYYAQDTILISSGFDEGGWNESTLYYNSDTTTIISTSLAPNEKFPVCIDCYKYRLENKECIMKYRDRRIKEFPFDQFEFEFFRSFTDFTREKWLIDDLIKKNK